MEMKGKKVLVFGSGISGEAAARLLLREGAQVILYDGNEDLRADKIMKKITDKLPDGEKAVSGTVSEAGFRNRVRSCSASGCPWQISRKNFLNSFP